MKKVYVFVMALVFALTALAPAAQVSAENDKSGKVVKLRGQNSLYYVSVDGKRYVFPNEKTYFSWYGDFSNVTEVNGTELANIPLGGNVVYRPGVLLVKIQTDPKVYAVSTNGTLRWVKTEQLAKLLYGDNWNLLVDDIPDSFFVNYAIGVPIQVAGDFDSDDEEDVVKSIDENRAARQALKTIKKNLNFCEKSLKQLNKLQRRLSRRGVTLGSIGDNFLQNCVENVLPAPGSNGSHSDKKIVICHIPPGNASARSTIVVGKSAARAHLDHGDTLGRCEGEGQTDHTAPVISSVSASTTAATSAQVSWMTNELSTSKVTYATSSLAVASSTQSVSSVALVTSHSLILTNLLPTTLYYFRVESMDADGNTATSTESTFTTPSSSDTTAPIISGVTATTTVSSATVAWSTNEVSDSEVAYATQPLATATSTLTVSSGADVTSHSLALTSLTASTTYYFRVKSVDPSGNVATSTQGTFTTQAIVDVTPPVISLIASTSTASTATITWTTNETSNSNVAYSNVPLASATTTLSQSNAAQVTLHSIGLTGLSATTTYYFRVESTDGSGNTASSTQNIFLTLP